jgi:hypothetical protein
VPHDFLVSFFFVSFAFFAFFVLPVGPCSVLVIASGSHSRRVVTVSVAVIRRLSP